MSPPGVSVKDRVLFSVDNLDRKANHAYLRISPETLNASLQRTTPARAPPPVERRL